MTDEEIDRLAELARIELDNEERRSMREDLSDILELAESIQEVDTEDVPPTYHAVPIDNAFDEDEVRPSLDRESVLDHAPDTSDGYFVVPRVIEDQ